MGDGREGQLRLALGPFQNRRLFSDHFLKDRLPEWPEFANSGQIRDLQQRLAGLWRAEQDGLATANEAQTEERWVQPVLHALGFAYTVQAGVRVGTGRRQPDYALFLDDAARAEADRLTGTARYAHALAVSDAKRFDRPLEGRGRAGALSEDPVAQIIHYVSVTRRRWGVLTNGRLWRLYSAAGDLVEGACYEVDLVALLEADDPAAFRYFALFFGARAFVSDREGRSFLDRALDESRANAVEVGEALERSVFAAAPLIAEGLLGDEERSDESLAAAFDHALVLLYRLLFCLHAEARALLPVDNRHYVRYGLARLARELAADVAAGRVFSARSDDLYNATCERCSGSSTRATPTSAYPSTTEASSPPSATRGSRVARSRTRSSHQRSTASSGSEASRSTTARWPFATSERSTSACWTSGSSTTPVVSGSHRRRGAMPRAPTSRRRRSSTASSSARSSRC